MKILPNLLTVDSDRANFPLHGGIYDFLVQSNESKVPSVSLPELGIVKINPRGLSYMHPYMLTY